MNLWLSINWNLNLLKIKDHFRSKLEANTKKRKKRNDLIEINPFINISLSLNKRFRYIQLG